MQEALNAGFPTGDTSPELIMPKCIWIHQYRHSSLVLCCVSRRWAVDIDGVDGVTSPRIRALFILMLPKPSLYLRKTVLRIYNMRH